MGLVWGGGLPGPVGQLPTCSFRTNSFVQLQAVSVLIALGALRLLGNLARFVRSIARLVKIDCGALRLLGSLARFVRPIASLVKCDRGALRLLGRLASIV